MNYFCFSGLCISSSISSINPNNFGVFSDRVEKHGTTHLHCLIIFSCDPKFFPYFDYMFVSRLRIFEKFKTQEKQQSSEVVTFIKTVRSFAFKPSYILYCFQAKTSLIPSRKADVFFECSHRQHVVNIVINNPKLKQIIFRILNIFREIATYIRVDKEITSFYFLRSIPNGLLLRFFMCFYGKRLKFLQRRNN